MDDLMAKSPVWAVGRRITMSVMKDRPRVIIHCSNWRWPVYYVVPTNASWKRAIRAVEALKRRQDG